MSEREEECLLSLLSSSPFFLSSFPFRTLFFPLFSSSFSSLSPSLSFSCAGLSFPFSSIHLHQFFFLRSSMEAGSRSDCSLALVEKVEGDLIKPTAKCEANENHGVCAICLERIVLQETALVKGCEHAYCVICILRWATYNKSPCCPQCKSPFDSLNVHRSLDGCVHDYMFEESVCLLLRASWFVPLILEPQEEAYEEQEDVYHYEDDVDEDDLEEAYFSGFSSELRIGNRRWGGNGYIRAGRKEARPVIDQQCSGDPNAGPSRCPMKKEVSREVTGRRAKRALKREAADKAAEAKHQQHLQRLGRK